MPNRPVEDDPDPESKSDLKAPRLAVPWERGTTSVIENLREFLFAPRVRVIHAGNLPLHAQCIWSVDTLLPRAQSLSLAIHVLVVSLLVLQLVPRGSQSGGKTDLREGGIFFPGWAPEPPAPVKIKKRSGGGSGGDDNPVPPTRGRRAPFSWDQFVAPSLPKTPEPRWQMTPTLVGPPEAPAPNIAAENWGLPKMLDFTGSNGPGRGDGQGNECCGGQGTSGQGRGYEKGYVHGVGGDYPQAGRGVTEVICSYCPNPAYTEEARKIKYNGIVMLRVVVGADGVPTDVRVTKSVGYGLDESALRTVRTWRFRPARDGSGRPVASWTMVEVNFHIY